MLKIAVLGPHGTFSELAAQKYLEAVNQQGEILLYPNIRKCVNAVPSLCNIAIIPIENSLDGYVQLTLDLLLQTDMKIIQELVLPIHFSFVSNCKDIKDVETVYAQFKTQGQCLQFLDQFNTEQIVTTESNGKSLSHVQEGKSREAAIVPQHTLGNTSSFPLMIKDVTDYEHNMTRFIAIAPQNQAPAYREDLTYKTSLVVIEVANEPGILAKILNILAKKGINLNSIMSRPTKKHLGKYHFFIDCDGHYPSTTLVKKAIDQINLKNTIKILGSYSSL